MHMAFTEIGIGNPTVINTEIEYADGTETRQPGFVKFRKLKTVYLRLWLGQKVYVLSTNQGFSTKRKNHNAFKLLFGISGYITEAETGRRKSEIGNRA